MLKIETTRAATMERAAGAASRRLALMKKRVELAEKSSKKSNPGAKRFVSDKFKDLNEECQASMIKK